MSVAKNLMAGRILEEFGPRVGRTRCRGHRDSACLRSAGEDEEMNRLAGFILDKGRYPWDVVS